MKTPSDSKVKLPVLHSIIQWVAHLWMIVFIPSVILVMKTRSMLPGVSLAFIMNSLFTILLYWEDKHCAKNNYWRIPERTLHFWEFLCGWPGALFAQSAFKHKRTKSAYMIVFWLCVIANVLAIAGLLFYFNPSMLGK